MSVFEASEEGFASASVKLSQASDVLYRSLENKLADPAQHYQAAIWQPKAIYIKELSDIMINYIFDLKKDLVREAGFKKQNGEETYRKDGFSIQDI
jgi:hypothetical protein